MYIFDALGYFSQIQDSGAETPLHDSFQKLPKNGIYKLCHFPHRLRLANDTDIWIEHSASVEHIIERIVIT